MSPATPRQFVPANLRRTAALVREVNAERWEINNAPENKRRVVCDLWVSTARALMEEPLSIDDENACLWVLRVVRKIASSSALYIKGLARADQDNWAVRARSAATRLRGLVIAQTEDREQSVKPKPKPVVVKACPASPKVVRSFPNLVGATVVVVGGEQGLNVLDRYREVGINLEWVPASVRQVEACADRIRRAGVNGVIFLTDRNPHKFQKMVRAACRAAETPFEWGASGIAAIEAALERLNERAKLLPKSA